MLPADREFHYFIYRIPERVLLAMNATDEFCNDVQAGKIFMLSIFRVHASPRLVLPRYWLYSAICDVWKTVVVVAVYLICSLIVCCLFLFLFFVVVVFFVSVQLV